MNLLALEKKGVGSMEVNKQKLRLLALYAYTLNLITIFLLYKTIL